MNEDPFLNACIAVLVPLAFLDCTNREIVVSL